MQLTDELAELITHAGPKVLDNADSFRAALDDFLSPDVASRGVINLLVDAVRQGAVDRLLRDISHGGDAEQAVAVCGDQLARDRATSETESSRWALAVLGFAAGAVDRETLEKYDAQAPVSSSQVPPAVAAPVVAPTLVVAPEADVAMPPTNKAPTDPVSAAMDTKELATRAAPPLPPTVGAAPVVDPPRRRRGRILATTAAVLLIVGGGVGAAALLDNGDGETPATSGSRTTSRAPTTATSATTDAESLAMQAVLKEAGAAVLANPSTATYNASSWSTARSNLKGGDPRALTMTEWGKATEWYAYDGGGSVSVVLVAPDHPEERGCTILPDCDDLTTSDGRTYSDGWIISDGGTHTVTLHGDARHPEVSVGENIVAPNAKSASDLAAAAKLTTKRLLNIATDLQNRFPLPDKTPRLPSWAACKYPVAAQPAKCPRWVKAFRY